MILKKKGNIIVDKYQDCLKDDDIVIVCVNDIYWLGIVNILYFQIELLQNYKRIGSISFTKYVKDDNIQVLKLYENREDNEDFIQEVFMSKTKS